jgi:hypothetical protein
MLPIYIYNNGDNFIISTRIVVDYFVKIIINRDFNINVVDEQMFSCFPWSDTVYIELHGYKM